MWDTAGKGKEWAAAATGGGRLHVVGGVWRKGAGGGDYMLGGMDTEMSWEAVNEAGGAEAERESA